MGWTIPLVMSNLNNNPPNQYGLVGVVNIIQTSSSPNTYTGTVTFTKPGNAFANVEFNLQNIQYPYPTAPYAGELYFEIGNVVGGSTTPVQLAQQFNQAGGYNPNGNNPPVGQGGAPPVFSFHALWDGRSNSIVNGQARLPHRLLAAYGLGNSGWQQVVFNAAGTETGTGGNLTISSQSTSNDTTMLYLPATTGNVVFQLNLVQVTGVVMILEAQTFALGGQITVYASTSSSSPGTALDTWNNMGNIPPVAGVYALQAFFIPSTNLQRGNNWITVANTGSQSVYLSKATFAW